jgi:hypothetical protein
MLGLTMNLRAGGLGATAVGWYVSAMALLRARLLVTGEEQRQFVRVRRDQA